MTEGVEKRGLAAVFGCKKNDAAERLACLDSPQGQFTYSYNPSNGLVESVLYGNGMQARYGYDVMDRLTAIEWVGADSNLIRRLAYGHDAAGMITNVTRETGERTAYAYDSLYRLTGESRLDAASNQVYAASWGYDLVGNRLETVEDGVTNTCTLGQGNRLAAFGAEGQAYQDAAGCATALVFDAARRLDLTWDSQYQLTAVATNGTAAEHYQHDALGRRVMTVSGGVTNWHVYDGPHVVADLTATGAKVRSYVWGPGIDNLLAMTVHGSTTNTYYALKDHLNSVLALVNAAGQIVEQYRYDAWGRTTVVDASGNPLTVSTVGNRYCWQGREYSWKTGLYYFRARWYDPITGRWLSNDPIGISGGLNQYVFCDNNPVNLIDPFGLDVWGVNRDAGGVEARSWFNPFAHTFLAITDDRGRVTETFSMTYDGTWIKTGAWEESTPWDKSTAQDAISRGMAKRLGDSSYDDRLRNAFKKVRNETPTWWLWDNCKHQARDLWEDAKKGCDQ